MPVQRFIVEIKTKERDGCGNYIRPLTEGDVRRALEKGLPHYDSVQVAYETYYYTSKR